MGKHLDDQCGLLFSFADMRKEIKSMKSLASPFLDVDTKEFVINGWHDQLNGLQRLPRGEKGVWEIKENLPLKTKKSNGECEPSKRGKIVQGQLTMIWEIKAGDIRKGQQSKSPHKYFALVGKASIKVSIIEFQENGDNKELARWRFEVGDSRSPGCHFHTQVLGGEEDFMFPKGLPVPRFPGFLVTPLDALDFLLGELFQVEWPKRQAQHTDEFHLWSSSQKNRLQRIIGWQMSNLSEYRGSPWITLKEGKPPIELLVK